MRADLIFRRGFVRHGIVSEKTELGKGKRSHDFAHCLIVFIKPCVKEPIVCPIRREICLSYTSQSVNDIKCSNTLKVIEDFT
jgi:hypothetical protein